MRPDQIQMLDDLAERLADTFIVEADPVNWSGAGKLPVDMDREERGDRHWCKKGAMGTGAVLKYVLDVKSNHLKNLSANPEVQDERDNELESQIRRAQKAAGDAMKRVMNKDAGKAEYDKHVHGRKG